MDIQTSKSKDHLIIAVEGRLDASWAEFFLDSLLKLIREGEHHLRVDASGLAFISSAGIRSLVRINKELSKVKGSFYLHNTNEFISNTLITTGFGEWLSDGDLLENRNIAMAKPPGEEKDANTFRLNENGYLTLEIWDAWQPWKDIAQNGIKDISFPRDTFALGIGCPNTGEALSELKFGEYMNVGGHVIYQSPDEKARPDFLIPGGRYIPQMLSIQTLLCRGDMAWLWRFSPSADGQVFGIAELAEKALEQNNTEAAAFVILAELDGMLGARLIKNPLPPPVGDHATHNELREVLSFNDERSFPGKQGLVFGLVTRQVAGKNHSLLKTLPSNPELAVHIHAAAFPYQPLQNGRIELQQLLERFFNGPSPLALLHLIDDNRPGTGMGETGFVRGALWSAPIKNKEGLL